MNRCSVLTKRSNYDLAKPNSVYVWLESTVNNALVRKDFVVAVVVVVFVFNYVNNLRCLLLSFWQCRSARYEVLEQKDFRYLVKYSMSVNVMMPLI